MAEIDVGDDSVRSIGSTAKAPRVAPGRRPWGSDRSASQRSPAQRATPTTTPSEGDEAPTVRRVRTEESAAPEVNELGFRDTTVLGPDVPPEDRPRSHRRKVASQEAPKPDPIPFDPNLSNLLLGLAQGMFTAAWGPDAAFTQKERELIQPPLGRMMQRLSPEDGAKFATMADPVFLAAGLLIWGMRIWTMQQKAVRPSPTAPTRPSGPVVQGMPADQVTMHHEPGTNGTNGSANAAPHIAAEWGGL